MAATVPAILLAHAAFWAAFTVTLVATRRGTRSSAPSATESATAATAATTTTRTTTTAPLSRTLVAVHAVGFYLLYHGLARALALAPPGAAPGSAAQAPIGFALIALGGGLACRALVHFRSWRLRAKLDAGHELATDGPFRWVRHPIYAALDLFALGSAIWVPAPLVWAGFALVVLGGDLRARAEERVLRQAFGPAYDAYCARTRRLLPGLY